MIKLSVLGTRDFTDREMLEEELSAESFDVLVTSGKLGADRMAQDFALDHDIPAQVILADYAAHGSEASHRRNLMMIEQSNRVIVFWDRNKRSTFRYLDFIKERGISFKTVFY